MIIITITTMHYNKEAGNRLRQGSQDSLEAHLHLLQAHTVPTHMLEPIKRKLVHQTMLFKNSLLCTKPDIIPSPITRTTKTDVLIIDLQAMVDIKLLHRSVARIWILEVVLL
jgi:hypothetical protein